MVWIVASVELMLNYAPTIQISSVISIYFLTFCVFTVHPFIFPEIGRQFSFIDHHLFQCNGLFLSSFASARALAWTWLLIGGANALLLADVSPAGLLVWSHSWQLNTASPVCYSYVCTMPTVTLPRVLLINCRRNGKYERWPK